MSAKNVSTIFKMRADNSGLEIKVSMKDLLDLFKCSAYDSSGIIKGREREFIECLIESLVEDPTGDGENPLITVFRHRFEDMDIDGKPFLEYEEDL